MFGEYSVAELMLGSGRKGLAVPISCLFEYWFLIHSPCSRKAEATLEEVPGLEQRTLDVNCG